EAQGYELTSDSASGTYRARLKETPPAPRFPAVPPTSGVTPGRAQAMELFVIALKHARAADVASNVNTLFGRGTFGQVQNASQSRTLADELRANQVPPLEAGTLAVTPASGTPARSATLTGDITIVADPRANSLLIRANRADFDLIKSIVDQ